MIDSSQCTIKVYFIKYINTDVTIYAPPSGMSNRLTLSHTASFVHSTILYQTRITNTTYMQPRNIPLSLFRVLHRKVQFIEALLTVEKYTDAWAVISVLFASDSKKLMGDCLLLGTQEKVLSLFVYF